jgi:3,4-dihydroxy-2-butanone 4-phosphate synthase
MVKVICHLYPMIAAKDEADRERLRPIGRNRELYQETLLGMNEIVRAADEMGVWGVSSIEHHFHSEGYEVAPNPGLLNAYWASQVKQIRVGSIGYTLTAQNPIRVAEDVAIIDHMTQGRMFVGISRGYQSRWTQVVGQHYGARATASPTGLRGEARRKLMPEKLEQDIKDDEINRRIFEEHADILLKAWTSESIRIDGATWSIPFPLQGIEWPMHNITRRFGAPGEVDDEGRIQRVSVVPAPYTNPHPPVFIASNTSPQTIEYAARRNFIPTYFTRMSRAVELARTYSQISEQEGRKMPLGKNQAAVRWMQVGDTDRDAHDAVLAYDSEIYRNLLSQLTPQPYNEADPVAGLLESGLWIAGSIDRVVEGFRQQWMQLPSEYVVLNFHYSQMPAKAVVHTLQMFMQHVKPVLDELTQYESESELATPRAPTVAATLPEEQMVQVCTTAEHRVAADPAAVAVRGLARGDAVMLADDGAGPGAGWLIASGMRISAGTMAFVVRHSSGFIEVPLTADRADRLGLPPMVPSWTSAGPVARPHYTVAVDAAEGITTGISAYDRALTVRLLADPGAAPRDFRRPGHVMPCVVPSALEVARRRNDGPLAARAAVHLVSAAGDAPVACAAGIVSEARQTQMATRAESPGFAARHGLAVVSIAEARHLPASDGFQRA